MYIMISYLHISLERSEGSDQYIETKIKLFSSNQKRVIDVSRDDVGVLGRGCCETEGEKNDIDGINRHFIYQRIFPFILKINQAS